MTKAKKLTKNDMLLILARNALDGRRKASEQAIVMLAKAFALEGKWGIHDRLKDILSGKPVKTTGKRT